MKNKLVISLVSIAVVAIVGIAAGLGLAGAFNSEDTSSAGINNPDPVGDLKPSGPAETADPGLLRLLVAGSPDTFLVIPVIPAAPAPHWSLPWLLNFISSLIFVPRCLGI